MTGSPQTSRADTAPLQRDNSRVHGERAATAADFAAADTTGGPGETTRPAFQQPHRPGPQPGPGGTAQWSPGALQQGHPAYYQQPAPVQRPHQATSRQQPVPQQPRTGSKITPKGWVLRGLVLFAVALVSGLISLLVKYLVGGSEGAEPPPQEQAQGTYRFDPQLREEGFRGCANVSTGKIQEYFQQHQCEHLTRALYTTTLPDGQRVLTSLATVRMPDAASAAQLNSLVTQDGTGNVQDLVSAGRDLPGDFPGLSQDVGYYSEQQDRLVVVGESGYFGKPDGYEDQRLIAVTRDALRLGWPQDGG